MTQSVPRRLLEAEPNSVYGYALLTDEKHKETVLTIKPWLQHYLQEHPELDSAKFGPRSRKNYVFAQNNPFDRSEHPMQEAASLFQQGLLSEVALGFEAEVKRNPGNCEAWYQLGLVHAENDDDVQAIAAMDKAHEADPTNRNVLLSLGVSHTNEMEAPEALGYLQAWLKNHPDYLHIPNDMSQPHFETAKVIGMFRDAAARNPRDADVHTALGVLYNLSREYDQAIGAFQRALEQRPQDHSLWNKLGATRANSSRSAEAIDSYQRALDLKPNYVRAWSNMGIGYANQGLYEEAVRYYVRALQLNPAGESIWNYLRMALICAGKSELVGLVGERNLHGIQAHYCLVS